MTAKLTLSIDEEVIKKAKLKAKQEGKSLSAMVEDYLVFASSDIKIKTKPKKEYADLVNRLAGSLKAKLPKNVTDKELIQQAIIERYNRKSK